MMLYGWPGQAPVCDPRMIYHCVRPRLADYVRINEATKCNCPRQCRRLLYDYTISQALFSDFHIKYVRDVSGLNNYTLDQLRYDQCVLQVMCSPPVLSLFNLEF